MERELSEPWRCYFVEKISELAAALRSGVSNKDDFSGVSRVAESSQTSVFLHGRWIAFVHPVRAKIVSDVGHLEVRESHRAQCVVSRFDVGAVDLRTTATINRR